MSDPGSTQSDGAQPAAEPAGTPPPSAGRTAWARNLATPVRDFLGTETGSALALVGAVVVALLWANVDFGSYSELWSTHLRVQVGAHGIDNELRVWVNEGLMTLFFLVVGLEAKREIDLGELREHNRLWYPALAALGGIAGAVGIYLLFNAGGPGGGGWGVAMSTDTALALGVLALVTPTGSTRLRVFLLTLVVFDDLAALVIIVVAYTTSIDVVALAVAAGLFAILGLLRFLPTARGPIAVVVGTGIWVALYESGIDPVIAGLAIGLVTSAYPPSRHELERATDLTREFREQPTAGGALTARRSLAQAISPNERIQYALHPWTSYVIVPLFALANAGVHITGGLLSEAIASPITIGIVVAYVVGKPLGIFVAPWLATRAAVRKLVGGGKLTITWPGLLGTGTAAGVGFTVSFLIASLAFSGGQLDQAKLGVLAASLISPLVAFAVFRGTRALIPTSKRLEQLRRTAESIIDLSDDVDPERDHIRGDPDGAVTLVEYADFECPYCGRAEPTVRELLDLHHGVGLRYVFRHLPLQDVHPHAQLAAEASEAAAAQDAFWPMHDTLMAHQGELDLDDVHRYAEELELDADRLEEEVRKRVYLERVSEDVSSADASGVSGTPTFFINGRRHQGVYDIDALTKAINRARILAEAEAKALAEKRRRKEEERAREAAGRP
ncbi:MAG: Na+/H+ antiporter NhaA [Actinobacteria bacterium]|nr:Na+/H+ antiporter NhaA [Actinomycetota bacterium]